MSDEPTPEFGIGVQKTAFTAVAPLLILRSSAAGMLYYAYIQRLKGKFIRPFPELDVK